MKNSNDTSRNGIRKLPVCSTVSPRATWKQVGEHKCETQAFNLPKLVSHYISAGNLAGCRMDNRRMIPDRGRYFSFPIMLRLTLGVTHQTCYQMSTKVELQQREAGQLAPNTQVLLLPVLVFHNVLWLSAGIVYFLTWSWTQNIHRGHKNSEVVPSVKRRQWMAHDMERFAWRGRRRHSSALLRNQFVFMCALQEVHEISTRWDFVSASSRLLDACRLE
jgi:hypothetical protein